MTSSRAATVRATLIIGGAAMVSLVFGLIRTKVAALLLGPVGVGLIGLLQNFVSMVANLFGLGISSSATRQIAASTAEEPVVHRAARRALLLLAIGLGTAGALLVFFLRVPIATQMLERPDLAGALAWLAPAVGLTIVGGTQTALLAGLRRPALVASATMLAGAVATTAACLGVWLGGAAAPILFVLAAPLASVLVTAAVIARSVQRLQGPPASWPMIGGQAREMIVLGLGFMGALLVSSGGQLLARLLVTESTGLAGTGIFQAAWMISMTYMGLILQVASSDYYPRLSELMARGEDPSELLNHQLEITFLFALPLLMVALVFAPLIVTIMFSSDFAEAAKILRWQVFGDFLKLVSWPLGFVLIAQGRSLAFIFAEAAATAALLLLLCLGLPRLGMEAAGLAYAGMYAVYLIVVAALVWSRVTLRPSQRAAGWVAGAFVALVLLAVLVRLAPTFANIACLAGVGVIAWLGWGEIRALLLARSQPPTSHLLDPS